MAEQMDDPIYQIRKAMNEALVRCKVLHDWKEILDAAVDALPDFFRQSLRTAAGEVEDYCNQQVGAAIERAAAELPVGFTIDISVECGAAVVKLFDANERFSGIEPSGDLACDIGFAIELADDLAVVEQSE